MKRIGNSFKGILGGLVAIIIGVVLLWWNEGNNVRNLKTTAEMDKSYIDVDSSTINPSNEGKLVATYGKIANEQELVDDTFGITIKTPLMKRIVEVYQWKEESSEDEDGDTTYSYTKEWSNELIDSGSFNKSGHDNPTQKLYEDKYYKSTDVKVGAFSLSSDQINMLSTDGVYNTFSEDKISGLELSISGNYITNSKDLSKPEIGDVRISFVYNNSTDVSILAVQRGNTFVDFVSSAGKTVNRVMDGQHSGAEMINVIKQENKMIKWILRVAGVLICVIGFATILKPISAITSYVPILGSLVGAAVGLVSFVLGLGLSLIVIAIAWIRFRPLLGIGLLAVVVALVVLLVLRGKKEKPAINNQVPEDYNNQNNDSNNQM